MWLVKVTSYSKHAVCWPRTQAKVGRLPEKWQIPTTVWLNFHTYGQEIQKSNFFVKGCGATDDDTFWWPRFNQRGKGLLRPTLSDDHSLTREAKVYSDRQSFINKQGDKLLINWRRMCKTWRLKDPNSLWEKIALTYLLYNVQCIIGSERVHRGTDGALQWSLEINDCRKLYPNIKLCVELCCQVWQLLVVLVGEPTCAAEPNLERKQKKNKKKQKQVKNMSKL